VSTYFIVSTQSESPHVYLGQGEYTTIYEALRSYSEPRRLHVFELKIKETLPPERWYIPNKCQPLQLVGVIETFRQCDHYRTLLGIEIDKLPIEQREEEIQKAIDVLEHKRRRAELMQEGR
jgi:hypothetical protein